MLDQIKSWIESRTPVRLIVNYSSSSVKPWEGTIVACDSIGLVLRDEKGRDICFTWPTLTEVREA